MNDIANMPIGEVDALLPCPFCGGDAGFFQARHSAESPVGQAVCLKCHAAPFSYQDKSSAIAAWNSRAASPGAGNGRFAFVLLGYAILVVVATLVGGPIFMDLVGKLATAIF